MEKLQSKRIPLKLIDLYFTQLDFAVNNAVLDIYRTVSHKWDGLMGWYLGWVMYRAAYGANEMF